MIGVGAGTGAGKDAAAGCGMNTSSGVGAGLAVPTSNVHASEIGSSRVWGQVTSRDYNTIYVIAFIILEQSRSWL